MGPLACFLAQVISTAWVYLLTSQLLIARPYSSVSGQTARQSQGGYPGQRNDNLFDPSASRSSEQEAFRSRVLQWHVHYCGKSRVCKDYIDTSCYLCSPCQCDLNCTHFEDCCPDVAIETGGAFIRPFTGSDTNVLSCEITSLQGVPSVNADISEGDRDLMPRVTPAGHQPERYLLVSRCPHTFTDDASECETSSVAPVTAAGNDSTLMFKNINCARCHDARDVVPWDIHISCERALNLSSLHTPREVIALSLSQSDCSVEYVSSSSSPRKCYSEPAMISRCNVTGQWSKRDSFLERACHSYMTPKRVHGVLYRNIFCFMCNFDDDPSHQMQLKSCQKISSTWSPAMEVTLRHWEVTRPETRDSLFGELSFKTCDQRGIYDNLEVSTNSLHFEKYNKRRGSKLFSLIIMQ